MDRYKWLEFYLEIVHSNAIFTQRILGGFKGQWKTHTSSVVSIPSTMYELSCAVCELQ